ncbi:MAG: 3D domain-containing protein [Eubacteriales bacterium]|nr:3D domain-containing protein [Eubacteriales bacterium]
MNLLSSIKDFHYDFTRVHLKRRAVPLAALAVVTAMTFPVIAVGMDVYTVTDGTTTEEISMYQADAEAAFERSSFDKEDYSIASVLENENGYEVTVKQNYYVTITVDGETLTVYTGDARVSSILHKAGIELSEDDLTEPSLDTVITEPGNIDVTRVTIEQKTQTKAIAYTTETRNSSDLEIGKSRVVQKGIEGVEEVTLEYTYHDGEEVSCAQIGTQVIKEPVTEIVENGTRQPTVTTSGGTSLSYSRVITVEATAYSGGGTTASGMSAQVGRIAVDPSVIPLGTRLYITSADGTSWIYGQAVAADTGGAIKGNRIDLYFNTEAECNSFGRRSAKVYILN